MESSGDAGVNIFFYRHHFLRSARGACWCLCIAFLCLSGWSLQAQESAQETVPDSVPEDVQVEESALAQDLVFDDLPGTRDLAAALSDRQSRTGTLMTMIAVAHMLEYGASADLVEIDALQARFRDERAWLDRLASRYPDLPMRGSQLDPAAWFVLLQLDQHQIIPGLVVSPLGPEHSSLMRQLFDRSDERLAAAVLPELLRRIEIPSIALWRNLLEVLLVNEALFAVVSGLNEEWFAPWFAVAPLTYTDREDVAAVMDDALFSLWALAGSTMMSGPSDALRLKRLRIDLLTALSTMDEFQLKDAEYLLVLASAMDGLNDGKYLAFTESLLWVASDLLIPEQRNQELSIDPFFEPLFEPEFELQPQLRPETESVSETIAEIGAEAGTEAEAEAGAEVEAVEQEVRPRSRIPRLLSELLPRLSNAFAGEFSEVDPRINATLAAIFDVMQYLQGDQLDQDRLGSLRAEIGDAVAQFVLLVPELNYYFDQPVRRRIAEEINVCTSIAANTDQQGAAMLSREQFDGCLESLVEMSLDLVTREELAGDPDGPFGADQLRRELRMPPWQRINFSLGYLHERFPTGCESPDQPLPNPLEWSGLATMVAWFARQAPVYFQTPENEALVVRMRQQGLDLLQGMAQQVDCISGAGTGIHDPVVRSLADYRAALGDLVAGIREVELQFRADRLKPGADVVLHGDASQQTAYRTEELAIGPCDPGLVCEMSGQLETTRALIGLFPDNYLIADQTGLGSIEICYENLQWVNRRAVPVRPDDPHVANYFGQLSFDLVGRYREKGQITKVFGSNFVSPDEYHYLFGPATDEVAGDSCPTEWVGSKIVTPLNNSSGIRIVPDRLTYLASAREKPSGIIGANWSRGAEWRDWFVTDLGVSQYEYEVDEGISDRVSQHLQTLYQVEQSVLYTALLRPPSRGGRRETGSLLDLQEELTARKALVRSYINLFYPDLLVDSEEIRGSLEGYDALLDTSVLRRFREANVAVASINEAGLSRLEQFQSDWIRQSDAVRRSGSIATGVAHAIIRLNTLYLDFFVLPAEKAKAREDVISPGGVSR
jgi:hypothetical protein